MSITFSLKVKNPVLPTGTVLANVNWSQPPFESTPDQMPTTTSAVSFTTDTPGGSFQLWAANASGGLVGGQTSPAINAENGVTYVWDMTANTVTKEGTDKPPIRQGNFDAIIAWAKANPWKAGAIGLGAFFLLGRRRIL